MQSPRVAGWHIQCRPATRLRALSADGNPPGDARGALRRHPVPSTRAPQAAACRRHPHRTGRMRPSSRIRLLWPWGNSAMRLRSPCSVRMGAKNPRASLPHDRPQRRRPSGVLARIGVRARRMSPEVSWGPELATTAARAPPTPHPGSPRRTSLGDGRRSDPHSACIDQEHPTRSRAQRNGSTGYAHRAGPS